MDSEKRRAHPLARDHSIAALLGGDRRGNRHRSRPLPEGAPAGTPRDCARRLRGRFVAVVVLLTVAWMLATCALGAGLAGNFLLYPYQEKDPDRERVFDVLPVWFGVVVVAGALLIALVAALGRMPWIAVAYAVIGLLCALLVHGIAGHVGDPAPDKPVVSSHAGG